MTDQLRREILEGIPDKIPSAPQFDPAISRAPKRRVPLTDAERRLALRNALRYFPKHHHAALAPEFARELSDVGHIYMYRFQPSYALRAYPLDSFPHRCKAAAAIMLMICNNLDPAVAQHPYELITYGGNGSVFQNWAQFRLTMKYLAEMDEQQTLVMYSGHPLGLFPSHADAPRAVVSNGMVIPNYSSPEHLDKFYALGVSQYGQMTAGSYMYIGPQGIVHGTTITILNAGRIKDPTTKTLCGKLFVSSGLGGMSGAQAKAAVIAGAVGIIAEVNPDALGKRYRQGWLNEYYSDVGELIARSQRAKRDGEAVSLGFLGNIVDLWEALASSKISVELGSDQTSLHNPYGGGYYPAGMSFEEGKTLLVNDPPRFRTAVQQSLLRQVNAINELTARGMYFFDYGNAFLLEASRAGADLAKADGTFRYPSYVQDIMGPLCFDFGFGPFRWICTSGSTSDLEKTDAIATDVLAALTKKAAPEIKQQLDDNLHWIKSAGANQLVVGSKARILYANAEGRLGIAQAFNKAIACGQISAPIVLGRDHHDVSGTDSPYRETSNIYDGSSFTADMAIQNVIGDSFRGASWVSIHNGGGVGWGEVINGGFGLVIDGSERSKQALDSMLPWDVNNGIARRSWARNSGAISAIKNAMTHDPRLQVTLPNEVDDSILAL